LQNFAERSGKKWQVFGKLCSRLVHGGRRVMSDHDSAFSYPGAATSTPFKPAEPSLSKGAPSLCMGAAMIAEKPPPFWLAVLTSPPRILAGLWHWLTSPPDEDDDPSWPPLGGER